MTNPADCCFAGTDDGPGMCLPGTPGTFWRGGFLYCRLCYVAMFGTE